MPDMSALAGMMGGGSEAQVLEVAGCQISLGSWLPWAGLVQTKVRQMRVRK